MLDVAIDFTKTDDFGFWMPFDIVKSKKTVKDGGRWIEGIASTHHEDLQKEIVDQNGIDVSYFLRYGYFNNDHKPGFENKVGQPTECYVKKDGLYVKGFLFKNKKIADDIWEMALSLESSDSDRKLGFSIQGKVIRRNGNRLLKCWVQDIAITAAPINTHTWLDIVKSLNALPSDIWCNESGCFVVSPEDAYKSLTKGINSNNNCSCKGKGCGSKKSSQEFAINEEDMDLKKDASFCGCSCSEKALSANSDGGRVITVESLEGNCKDQGYGRIQPEHEKSDEKEEETRKSILTFDESVAYIQAYNNLPQPEAQIVARAIFEMNGIY